MGKSYNHIFLKGKVGKDSDVKKTSGGTAFVNISIATSRKVKDDWKTDWHNVTVWGKDAKSVRKGDTVAVRGEYVTNKWTDKNGQERKDLQVSAFDLMIESKNPHENQAGHDQSGDFRGNPDIAF